MSPSAHATIIGSEKCAERKEQSMRGLYSSKTKIRHQIFTEIARMAYEGGDCSKLEELPYKIVPGEVAS